MSDSKSFGRYKVKKILGRGAMGVVYLAEDPVIRREVAIKVIQAHPGLEKHELEQLQARFEREFQSAGTLSHPNIVTIHDVGQEGKSSFIAMEFVRGESLDSIIASNRVLSFMEIADLTSQICDALDYAHERGVVHRDIKPANIIITREGRPKIADFGIAKLTTTTLTRTGTVIGTPSYMSPEQVTGHPVTGASDQFSVAIVAYELLTGERPFKGEEATTIMYKIVHEEPVRPRVVNAQLPQALDDAQMKALEKDPAQRYPTCRDFAEAVRANLGAAPPGPTVVLGGRKKAIQPPDEEASTLPGQKVSAPSAWWRRTRVPLIVSAAAVVAVLVSVWLILGNDNPNSFSGDIDILSEPAGADIQVNGERRGRTPGSVTLQGSVGDTVRLELMLDEKVVASSEVVLGDQMPATWDAGSVGLFQSSVQVTSEPSEVEIRVNGETRGRTPNAVPLEGRVGDGVTLELVLEGEVVARTEIILGDEMPARWDAGRVLPVTYTITSEPPGAQVFLDDREIEGVTPVQVELVSGQRYEVRIVLADHEPGGWAFSDDELNDDQRSRQVLHFVLEGSAPPGLLVLSGAPYPVAITVRRLNDAGDPTGQVRSFEAAQDHQIELASGVYEVELSAPSVYFQRIDRLSIRAEASQPLVVPRAVNARVIAVPGNCRVSIDGRYHDSTPFGVALVIGAHEFHFDWSAVGEGGKTVTHTVTREGQQIREQSGQQ